MGMSGPRYQRAAGSFGAVRRFRFIGDYTSRFNFISASVFVSLRTSTARSGANKGAGSSGTFSSGNLAHETYATMDPASESAVTTIHAAAHYSRHVSRNRRGAWADRLSGIHRLTVFTTRLCRAGQRRQYSLRALVLVTLLIAVCLAWWANTSVQQRRAVQILRAGRVGVACPGELFDSVPPEPSWAPGWFQSWLGRGYFHSPHAVCFSGVSNVDSLLTQVQYSRGVRDLYIDGFLTDTGMARIGDTATLEILHIHNAQITDAGTKALSRLTRVSWLVIEDTPIADAGRESSSVVRSPRITNNAI